MEWLYHYIQATRKGPRVASCEEQGSLSYGCCKALGHSMLGRSMQNLEVTTRSSWGLLQCQELVRACRTAARLQATARRNVLVLLHNPAGA